MSKRTTTTRTTEYDADGNVTKTTEVVEEMSDVGFPFPYRYEGQFYIGDVPPRLPRGGYTRSTGTTLRS